MVVEMISSEGNAGRPCLTDKQVEVLQLVCDRRTNKEIALLLGISPSAVEQRLQSVRRKFGVHSRADLARAYEKLMDTCANRTGVEYQVETSILDGQVPFEKAVGQPTDIFTVGPAIASSVSARRLGRGRETSILEVFDRISGLAGRIAAITTAAASIALLVVLIAKVAPSLNCINNFQL